MTISDNDVLVDVDGLVNLSSVGDDVTISDNDVLGDVDGLLALSSVGGVLAIQYNQSLCQSSVDSVMSACGCGSAFSNGNNDDGC